MICSRCHQSIPSGEEVQRSGGWFVWWMGSETVCKKCSVIRQKQQKIWIAVFIGFMLLSFLLSFLFTFVFWKK